MNYHLFTSPKTIQGSSLDSIKKAKYYYRELFKQDIIKELESSTNIQILRPLLQGVYDDKQRKFFSTTVEVEIASKIKCLDIKESLLLVAERNKQEQREKTLKQTSTAAIAGAVAGATVAGSQGAAIGAVIGVVVADYYGGFLGLFLPNRIQ